MVEFTLIVVVLFSLLVCLIEVTRYFVVQALATKGAEEGLELAQKAADFDADTRELRLSVPADSALYNRFIGARQRIAERAAHLVQLVYVSPTSSRSWLVTYSISDPLSSGSNTDTGLQAVILRPGDSSTYINPFTNTTELVNHPNICPQGARIAGCQRGREAYPADSMDEMLRNQLIVVEVRVAMTPIFRFLTSIIGFNHFFVVGRASGYRGLFPSGRFVASTGAPVQTSPSMAQATSAAPSPPSCTQWSAAQQSLCCITNCATSRRYNPTTCSCSGAPCSCQGQ
jgi:hypothetical protein